MPCAYCNVDTDFICHSPSVCIRCGDNVQQLNTKALLQWMEQVGAHINLLMIRACDSKQIELIGGPLDGRVETLPKGFPVPDQLLLPTKQGDKNPADFHQYEVNRTLKATFVETVPKE